MTYDTYLLKGCCDDSPDYLADKPCGRCPDCNHVLMTHIYHPGTVDSTSIQACFCGWWDVALTEDENRIRYAAEKLESAQIGERIIRESRRAGGGREL